MNKFREFMLGAGIILAGAGFVSLPFGGSGNPKLAFNSMLPLLTALGIFSRPGLLLMAIGAIFILVSNLLPKK